MKKILLATTVLVGTAGFAAAEVSLSGSAAMGVVSNPNSGNKKPQFSSRAKINFDAALETDNGLSLGASFGAGDAENAKKGAAGTVSISGPFGKLEMGDNYSAAGTLVGDVSGVGYSGHSTMSANELGYIGAVDAPNAAYTYTFGDVSVSASTDVSGVAKSAAAQYKTDLYSFAIGYEAERRVSEKAVKVKEGNTEVEKFVREDNGQVSLGGSVSIAGAELKVVAVDDLDASKIGYAASVDYSVSDVGLTVFGTSNKSFGLGGAYDLGGGAKFKTGAVKSKDQKLVYDAGVTFSF